MIASELLLFSESHVIIPASLGKDLVLIDSTTGSSLGNSTPYLIPPQTNLRQPYTSFVPTPEPFLYRLKRIQDLVSLKEIAWRFSTEEYEVLKPGDTIGFYNEYHKLFLSCLARSLELADFRSRLCIR